MSLPPYADLDGKSLSQRDSLLGRSGKEWETSRPENAGEAPESFRILALLKRLTVYVTGKA
jgi:hypothetical protein